MRTFIVYLTVILGLAACAFKKGDIKPMSGKSDGANKLESNQSPSPKDSTLPEEEGTDEDPMGEDSQSGTTPTPVPTSGNTLTVSCLDKSEAGAEICWEYIVTPEDVAVQKDDCPEPDYIFTESACSVPEGRLGCRAGFETVWYIGSDWSEDVLEGCEDSVKK
jgi:hypothetical protein